jgi:hypothetical protein
MTVLWRVGDAKKPALLMVQESRAVILYKHVRDWQYTWFVPPGGRTMRREDLTIALLLIIAVALVAIAVQPFLNPRPAQAQANGIYPFYIEPGSEMLRAPDGSKQVYGKVVVDLTTGKIWGFPTLAPQSYPSAGLQNKPPTSRPFELGRFAFEDTAK